MYPVEHEIAEALIRYVFENGGPDYEVTAGSTYAPLAAHFGLTEDERTRTRYEEWGDGKAQRAWDIRVQWARNTLRKNGELRPSQRGYWRLSQKAIQRCRETNS